jgi:peptidoglycan/xylan/chitin deacetylase (PgdA/CDA1 family)
MLPFCIESTRAPQIAYAAEELLRPLGQHIRLVNRGELPEGGLYYGTEPPPGALAFAEGREFGAPAAEVSWDGESWPVLFATPDGVPDLLMSAFHWLSGAQERAVRERDRFGRFSYWSSLQARLNVAERPVVDAYREVIAEMLVRAGHPVARSRWKGAPWAMCVTHDIDYGRKWRKGILYREIVEGPLLRRGPVPPEGRPARLRRSLAQALSTDPYRDALWKISGHLARYDAPATIFLKAGHHGPHDVSYPIASGHVRWWAHAMIDRGFEVGLHPSFFAHTHAGYFRSECDKLEEIFGVRPRSVRQHYLRYDHDLTPPLHAATAFRQDSSLGFAEHEGFRSGTCHPFRLFDHPGNRPLPVWEIPLCVMDATLFYRRSLDADGAVEATRRITDQVRRFGGVAVMLWHNVLWDEIDHPGWGDHFERTLEQAASNGARFVTIEEARRLAEGDQ